MYEVVRVLASNGPVRVELVRTRTGLAVVKRLHRHHPILERRLVREAQVVSRLKHPGIVSLSWAEDGRIAYAYVPGATLDAVLESGPLPAPRVASFTRQLLGALRHAHDEGVVHHDVKPGNVVVRGETVRLLDFGFAKDLTLASITTEDTAMGTPHYMAPEQFLGTRSDPRSDLYGVAATTFHMLAGKPPYGRDVLRVLIGDLPPDLRPDLEGLVAQPGVDPAWGPWFEQGLAFDPATRFASAADMVAALPPERVVPAITVHDLATLPDAVEGATARREPAPAVRP